jgi:hypothetical protein
MRFLAWIGISIFLSASCGWVVSFNGLADGTTSSPTNLPDGAVDEGAPVEAGDAPEVSSLEPIVIRKAKATLRGIDVTAEHVYWVEGDMMSWGVYRVSKQNDAGPPEQVGNGDDDIFDVAVEGDSVYWSNGSTIKRAPLGDASAPVIYLELGAAEARYIAVNSLGRVYVTTSDAVYIGPCPSFTRCNGTDPVFGNDIIRQFAGIPGVSGIALGTDLLFWGHEMAPGDLGPGVTRVSTNLDSPVKTEMDRRKVPEHVSAVASDGVEVFWMAGDHAILATPVTGAPDDPRVVYDDPDHDAGFGPEADIAVDDDSVYFTRQGLLLKYPKKK